MRDFSGIVTTGQTTPRLAIAADILSRPLPDPWSWRYLDDLLREAIDVQQEPSYSQAHLHLANIVASHFHAEVAE